MYSSQNSTVVVLNDETNENQQQESPVEKERVVGTAVDSEEDNEQTDRSDSAKGIGGKTANKKPVVQRKVRTEPNVAFMNNL